MNLCRHGRYHPPGPTQRRFAQGPSCARVGSKTPFRFLLASRSSKFKLGCRARVTLYPQKADGNFAFARLSLPRSGSDLAPAPTLHNTCNKW